MPHRQANDSTIHAWLRARGVWTRRLVALAAGALATAGHAPLQLTLAYLIAIVVLVWLIDTISGDQKPLRRGFALGLFFGLGHFGTGMYWIADAFNVESDLWGPIWGIPAAIAMGAGMALFWGAGAALAARLWCADWRRIFALALGLSLTEWLRGHLFGGLPWLLPGYVWTPGEPVSQLASLVGIYGLSALTLALFAAPACALDARSSSVGRFMPLLAASLALGLAWGWGVRRMDAAPPDALTANPVIVRVADTGLSQDDKWRAGEWEVLRRFAEVSGDPREAKSQIVIWPEGAIPAASFFALDNPEFLQGVANVLGDRVLITGLTRCAPEPECASFMRREAGADGLHFYNSAAVIDSVAGRPRIGQVYDKHRLVPFGEFIPLWSLVSRLNIAPLQRIGAGFDAGPPPQRMILPDAPPVVPLICYEAIFPGLTPTGDARPGWLVSITNDAWFGKSMGPWQHFAMARYRSIEEGLPMARAASGGVSAIVDSYGRVIARTGLEGGFAEAQLPSSLPETLFARWGFLLTPIFYALLATLRFSPLRARGQGSIS